MVHISLSSDDLHPSRPSLSNIPWTADAATKDVILGVCVTVAGVFTLCVLLTFTSCCCRKRKSDDPESGSEDGEEKERGLSLRKKKDPLKKAPSSSRLDNTSEGSTSLKQLEIRKSCPNFQDVDLNSLSVKDRIKAFEFFQNDPDVKLRDGSKPKRKKPTSKAFDDFENQGILIGFGGNQRRKTPSTEGLTQEWQDAGEELKDYHQLPPIPSQHPQHPHHQNQHPQQQQQDNRLSNQQESDDKGTSDEFEAVQRNTDILKSFRRAPPPKNRTRARRSGRRRPPGANEGVESIAEDREDEEKEFESSLHMQPSTPQSSGRTSIRAIERPSRDMTDLLNRSFRDSPQSQRASLRSQRGPAIQFNSDRDLKSRKENQLTVDFNKDFDSVSAIRSRSFSEGLSNNNINNTSSPQHQQFPKATKYPQTLSVHPFTYSLNPANVTLSSLRRDLPIGKKTDINHNGHSNDNWSPQPQRPVSVGGVPMRRWASDHNSSAIPRDVPRSPLLDVKTWATQGPSNKDTSSAETGGRKCSF